MQAAVQADPSDRKGSEINRPIKCSGHLLEAESEDVIDHVAVRVEDGRVAQWWDLQGAAGCPRHWLLLRPGQP